MNISLSSAKSASSPYQKNKSDLYEQYPMYQDTSTTNFYNLLFSARKDKDKEEEVTTETEILTTTESATTSTLSYNDVNFPHDDTKYIKISSSIEIPETESVKITLDALKVLWNASLTSLWKGFMPSMERVRRDTSAFESTKGIYTVLKFLSIFLSCQDSSLTGLLTSSGL